MGNKHNSFLIITEDVGVCWEDNGSQTIDEALKAAEKYLKEEEFPERFDEETISEIEDSQK